MLEFTPAMDNSSSFQERSNNLKAQSILQFMRSSCGVLAFKLPGKFTHFPLQLNGKDECLEEESENILHTWGQAGKIFSNSAKENFNLKVIMMKQLLQLDGQGRIPDGTTITTSRWQYHIYHMKLNHLIALKCGEWALPWAPACSDFDSMRLALEVLILFSGNTFLHSFKILSDFRPSSSPCAGHKGDSLMTNAP